MQCKGLEDARSVSADSLSDEVPDFRIVTMKALSAVDREDCGKELARDFEPDGDSESVYCWFSVASKALPRSCKASVFSAVKAKDVLAVGTVGSSIACHSG